MNQKFLPRNSDAEFGATVWTGSSVGPVSALLTPVHRLLHLVRYCTETVAALQQLY
jgi:hypothetical protein